MEDLIEDILNNIDSLVDDYKLNEYGYEYDIEKPYSGILNKKYKHCGKQQCSFETGEDIFRGRCLESVYQENAKHCHHHRTISLGGEYRK